MKRREFIGGFSAATAWPLVALAQQTKLYRIGGLLLGNADAESFQMEMREGLRKSGFIEGQNLLFDFRSAEGKVDLLPKLAAELVALKVDVIVALYTPCALAAQQATHQIPIVVVSGDPVETGLVTSLAHPGGNVTGISLMAAGFMVNVSNCSAISSRPCAESPFFSTPRIPFGNRSKSKSSLQAELWALKFPPPSRCADRTRLMRHSRP